MAIISCSGIQQDTVKSTNIVLQDSVGIKPHSNLITGNRPVIDSVTHKSTSIPKPSQFVNADTTSVCTRNNIIDITFNDSSNVLTNLESGTFQKFPFVFTEKNRQVRIETKTSLVKHLKSGMDLPVKLFHDDWLIVIILITGFLYSLIRTSSKILNSGVTRFFLFRGTKDPFHRDIGGLFHWQTTILNLVSFMIIGLFAYSAASFYDVIPDNFHEIIFWLILVGIIIFMVSLRHIVCMITGNVSGELEAFREYLFCIYQSYRYAALFLYILIFLIFYTVLLPAEMYFIAGIIILGTMYLIRMIRLLIIFLNRNISIFYLILYLCALEILPVLISLKYFSGLV